jgi:hypothetical protein
MVTLETEIINSIFSCMAQSRMNLRLSYNPLLRGVGLSDGAILPIDGSPGFSDPEAEPTVYVGVSGLDGVDVDRVIGGIVEGECGVSVDGTELKTECGFVCIVRRAGMLSKNRGSCSATPPTDGECEADKSKIAKQRTQTHEGLRCRI